MADVQIRHVSIKKIGWRRVAKNFMRFGWDLTSAEQETTTTYDVKYEGKIINDKIEIQDKTEEHTKVRVNLSFYRRKTDYKNLAAVMPIELVYNICFYARRLIGFVLPFYGLILFIMMMAGMSGDAELLNTVGMPCLALLFVWAGLIILEGVFSRIAGKILGIKIVRK